jgi:chemotaxis protein methyltransferase CheR
MRVVICSRFFHDPESWNLLADEVLPGPISRPGTIQLWSAGCATGKECYSLAILAAELGFAERCRILATDVDAAALAAAKDGGPYTSQDIAYLSSALRARYLKPGGPPFYVRDALRRNVEFRHHDLRFSPVGSSFTLVLCRDVQPFFTWEECRTVHRHLRDALHPGGILFLGATDRLLEAAELGFQRLHAAIYRLARR